MIKLTCAICGKEIERKTSYFDRELDLLDKPVKMPPVKSYTLRGKIINERPKENS